MEHCTTICGSGKDMLKEASIYYAFVVIQRALVERVAQRHSISTKLSQIIDEQIHLKCCIPVLLLVDIMIFFLVPSKLKY